MVHVVPPLIGTRSSYLKAIGAPPEKVESLPEPEDVSDLQKMSTAELALVARGRARRLAAQAAEEEAASATPVASTEASVSTDSASAAAAV